MAKKVKKEKAKKGVNIFDEDESAAASSEEELPKDEAGRRKIKRQYEDLLGIRGVEAVALDLREVDLLDRVCGASLQEQPGRLGQRHRKPARDGCRGVL